MRPSFVLAALIAAFASSSSATTLYKYTFDNTTSTTFGPNERYVPGSGEIESNVTGTGSALGALSVTEGTTSPTFVTVASLGGSNSPVQGGKAVRCHAGQTPDGVDVDFDPAFGGPFSMTIEASFLVKTLNPTSNTANLAYIFSTEWPFAGELDHNLRTLNGTLQYVVTTSDGEFTVNALAPLVINKWYHAAGVVNYNSGTPANSTIQLYLDGVSQGTTTVNLSAGKFIWFLGNSHSGTNRSLGNMFALGHNPGSDGGGFGGDVRGLDGAIDAVAVSDTALGPGTFVLTQPASAADWQYY